MDTSLNYITLRPENLRSMLLEESKNWIGVTEGFKNNTGQCVERFQKSVSLEAGSPWCLAFIWYCIDRVESMAKVLDQEFPKNKLYRTGHVLTLLRNSSEAEKLTAKEAGSGDLILWNKRGTTSGHIGIIVRNNHNGTLLVCEGNTSDGSGVERDGDGVHLKNRLVSGYGNMDVISFLRVW